MASIRLSSLLADCSGRYAVLRMATEATFVQGRIAAQGATAFCLSLVFKFGHWLELAVHPLLLAVFAHPVVVHPVIKRLLPVSFHIQALGRFIRLCLCAGQSSGLAIHRGQSGITLLLDCAHGHLFFHRHRVIHPHRLSAGRAQAL